MSSPSATIEAALRLDIAQLQAAFAESKGEATKWREKFRAEGRKAAEAVDPVVKAHALAAASMASARAVNPWTTASAGAMEYERVLNRMTPAMARAHALLAESGARTAAQFAPKATNPWTTASAGYKAPERISKVAWSSEADNTREMERQALLQRQAQQRMQAIMGRGGAGMRGMGQVAMQAQDIAVQLQMGTKASIVLAQQGSQLLSAFGAGGAIAGGVIAIGGAFYTMGENARQAFTDAQHEARRFDSDIKRIATGSVSDLVKGLDLVDDRVKNFTDELAGLSGKFSFAANIADVFGGPSVEDRIAQAGRLLEQSGEQRVKLANQLLETSGQEAQIAQLRAAGEKEKADEMERQLKLAHELARIDALQLPRNMRDQLAGDARAKSAAEATTPKDIAKEKEDILEIEKKLSEQTLKNLPAAERFVEIWKQQDAIYASMADKGGLFFEQNADGMQQWVDALRKSGDTGKLLEVLKLQEQAVQLQEQMNQANEEAKADTAKREQEADVPKKAAHDRSVLDLEVKIAREKAATGSDDSATVKAFQDELNTLQLQTQLQEQLKVSSREALDIAREKVSAERAATDAIDGRKQAEEDANKAKEEAEKQQQQTRSRQEFAAEMRVDALRAQGNEKGAKEAEKSLRIGRLAEQIQESQGLAEAEALQLARQRIELQERAQKREQQDRGGDVAANGRKKIHGYSHGGLDYDRYGLSGRAGGSMARRSSDAAALDAVSSLRGDSSALPPDFASVISGGGKKPVDPVEAWMKRGAGGKTGSIMNLSMPMTGMQERNVERQGEPMSKVESLMSKLLEVTRKGFG